ncbi:hypothetical protein QCA50_013602 [Cerrena zonata]|uniref:Uncharacterized protein n=1 Tax=Cerrena zonata TaxID=2478898 RepID=A0AAW0FPY7_9APHY
MISTQQISVCSKLLEERLEYISTYSRHISKRLFHLRSSKNGAFVDPYQEAYSRLRWSCKDVAGDIRSSITDFNHAILKSLEGGNLSIKDKFELIDGWAMLESNKKVSASGLPKEFEKLADDMLLYGARTSHDITCLPVVQRAIAWIRHGLERLTVSSQSKSRWKIVKMFAKLMDRVPLESSGASQGGMAEMYAISGNLRTLGKDVVIFDELYGQVLYIVSIVRAMLDIDKDLNDPSIVAQLQHIRSIFNATAAALENFQKAV